MAVNFGLIGAGEGFAKQLATNRDWKYQDAMRQAQLGLTEAQTEEAKTKTAGEQQSQKFAEGEEPLRMQQLNKNLGMTDAQIKNLNASAGEATNRATYFKSLAQQTQDQTRIANLKSTYDLSDLDANHLFQAMRDQTNLLHSELAAAGGDVTKINTDNLMRVYNAYAPKNMQEHGLSVGGNMQDPSNPTLTSTNSKGQQTSIALKDMVNTVASMMPPENTVVLPQNSALVGQLSGTVRATNDGAGSPGETPESAQKQQESIYQPAAVLFHVKVDPMGALLPPDMQGPQADIKGYQATIQYAGGILNAYGAYASAPSVVASVARSVQTAEANGTDYTSPKFMQTAFNDAESSYAIKDTGYQAGVAKDPSTAIQPSWEQKPVDDDASVPKHPADVDSDDENADSLNKYFGNPAGKTPTAQDAQYYQNNVGNDPSLTQKWRSNMNTPPPSVNSPPPPTPAPAQATPAGAQAAPPVAAAAPAPAGANGTMPNPISIAATAGAIGAHAALTGASQPAPTAMPAPQFAASGAAPTQPVSATNPNQPQQTG